MGRRPLAPRHLTEISLADAVNGYLRHIRESGAPGSTTVRNKAVYMRALIDFVGADTPAWKLRSKDLTEVYIRITEGADEAEAAAREAAGRRRRAGLQSKGSQAQARSALKQFAEFCHHYEYLDKGVTFSRLRMGETRKESTGAAAEKPRLAREEWDTALDLAERRHMRLRIVVAFGLYYARRVSEITALQWKNIRLDDASPSIIFKIVKRGKNVVLPMLPEMYEELLKYRTWMEANYGPVQPDWFVVPARISTRLIVGAGSRMAFIKDPAKYPLVPEKRSNIVGINTDVRHVLAAWGWGPNEGTGTHTFRRSAARYIAQTHGLDVAQALLGHQNIATTELYVGGIDEYDLIDKTLGGVRASATAPDDANVIPIDRKRTA